MAYHGFREPLNTIPVELREEVPRLIQCVWMYHVELFDWATNPRLRLGHPRRDFSFEFSLTGPVKYPVSDAL